MYQLVYETVNLRAPYGDHRVDVAELPEGAHVWAVFGPGLPVVNGSFRYQKGHTKQDADAFCEFVNHFFAIACEHTLANVRRAIGATADPREAQSNELWDRLGIAHW